MVLVDAGLSMRQTARRLEALGVRKEEIGAILLTHEHTDHVAGAARISRTWRIPVICRQQVAGRARLLDQGAAAVRSLPEGTLDLGDLRVTPFPVSHDAVETVGFVLEGEGMRAGYATDLGEVTPEVEEALQECHLLALEANHDVDMIREGPYPWALKQRILASTGHLSNEAAGALLGRLVGQQTRQVLLTHLSEINNSPERALMSARSAIQQTRNPEVSLEVARQGRPGSPWRL